MEPPPRLLILGAGPFQGPLLATARRLGAYTIALDRNPKAASRVLADEFVLCDIGDPEAVLTCARDLEIDGVASAASDIALPAHARVAHRLNLPGPSPDAVARSRDKLCVFDCLRKAGLPTPETVAADQGTPVGVGGYPIVVKPAKGAGGRGVSIVDGAGELAPAIALAQQYGPPLFQAFVDGEAFGLEAFLVEGRVAACFSFEDQLRPPFPSPIGHATPSARYEGQQSQLETLVEAVARALGVVHGGLNLDLRWTDAGPVILEVNPRSGGAQLGPLVHHAYGVDLCAAAVSLALGWHTAPHLTRQHQRPGASRLFVLKGRGPLDCRNAGRETIFAPWQDDPRLKTPLFEGRHGEPAPTVVDQWSLVGHCLVASDSIEEAIALADEIDDHIRALVEVLP